MQRRESIAARVGLPAAALIFAAVSVGVLLGAQRFIADSRQVAHTNQVIAAVDGVEARLRDAEAAQRGYLLTGRVELLADHRSSRDRVMPLLDQLEGLVQDNPAQGARVQRLQALAQLRIAQMSANLGLYEKAGLAAAQAGIDDEVDRASSGIRDTALALLSEERRLLDERSIAGRRSADVLRALALLGIPLGIALVGVVYWMLVREIRRRGRAERIGAQANERLRNSVQELERYNADLGELTRYGGLLQNCLSPREAISLTTQLLSQLLPGTGGTVYRIRASNDYAEIQGQWGEHLAPSAPMLPLEDCWGLRRGQPHALHSGEDTLRCAHIQAEDGRLAGTCVCIPLSAQGSQLGFVYVSAREEGILARMPMVQAATEQLSMALHNLALQERLRIQSIRDPLTGLFNRRYLEESLNRELARCERRGQPLSLIMLDLDHFKAFNDLHGHSGGDSLLAEFGHLLQKLARSEDIACRYGGEEFTLILPEASLEQARVRAEEICAAVRTLRVVHLGQELPAVSSSIGIATFRGGNDPGEAILRRADQALYRAKQAGRDRAEVQT